MDKKLITRLKPYLNTTGVTYKQDKLLKSLMNPQLHKQFIDRFSYGDWSQIVYLLYYVRESPSKLYHSHVLDLAENMEIDYRDYPEIIDELGKINYHALDNALWELQQPYFDEIHKLSNKESLIYGEILKCIGLAYANVGVATDRQVVGNEIIKAGQLLSEYNLDGYDCYLLEGNKIYGWWE